jgi:RimJ/RimL family protein N-acetyltransferase
VHEGIQLLARDDDGAAARTEAGRHGARELAWSTAPSNVRAQRVYDRVGAERSEWIEYALPVDDEVSRRP